MHCARSVAILAAVTAFCASMTGASAQGACPTSAVLANVQGNVLINSGGGFAPARAGSAVRAGDQISVRGAGSATVDFGAGRIVNVSASSTQTVRAPGCNPNIAQPNDATAMVAGGIASAAVIGGAIALANKDGGGRDVVRPVSP